MILEKLEEFGFNKEEARVNILANRHDHITTTYYLILKKHIRDGKTSVADLVSKEFMDFINDSKNLLSYSNHNPSKSTIKSESSTKCKI
jgi:hypothetical protein